jgi:hypothetical protein
MGITLFLIAAVAGYCLIKQFSSSDRPVVSFSGGVVLGCILSGTLLYVIDLFFVKVFQDFSNGTLAFMAIAIAYIVFSVRRLDIINQARIDAAALFQDRPALWSIILFLGFSAWLNWHSLNVTANGNMLIANGAWSDLMYHVSYVRSVALGNNVPIQYPYFANEAIRYHFLFDYLAGKISQLGLHSVNALNLMSTVGLVCLLTLIFEFGRVVFKSAATGFLGSLLLLFHSSYSVFPWIKNNLNRNVVQTVIRKDGWLSGAPFEEWGLFNLNVFINQRHFALVLALLVLLVIMIHQDLIGARQVNPSASPGPKPKLLVAHKGMKSFLFWGVIIGSLPFWNAILAGISIIFVVAFAIINRKNRVLFQGLMFTAVIAFLIAYPQLMLFKSGDSALAGYPNLHFGYALNGPSPIAFVLYYLRVLGFKIAILVAAFLLLERRLKLLLLVLLVPFVLANALQFSSVLYDNNKLIITSLVFLNCYAAYVIVKLFEGRRIPQITLAIILGASITLAGVVDFFAARNLKQTEIADESSQFRWWIVYKTAPRAVFLTNVFIPYADNAISTVNLAGRYLYVVQNCVSSSCNVDERIQNARKIYSFEGGAEQVKSLLKKEKIDYVLVDEHVRNNPQLGLNERAFIENFQVIYKDATVTLFKPSS